MVVDLVREFQPCNIVRLHDTLGQNAKFFDVVGERALHSPEVWLVGITVWKPGRRWGIAKFSPKTSYVVCPMKRESMDGEEGFVFC